MKIKKKIVYKVLAVLFALLAICFIGLCIYASDYRTLDQEYQHILELANVEDKDGIVNFTSSGEVGIIFYPGGRVEYTAYTPFCQKLQQAGIDVFLVDMPFNMANFGVNKANAIMEDNPHIENWYISGHSLGGVAASMYAAGNAEKIDGLLLVGIYLAMDYPLSKTITINGSNDLRVGDGVTYTENVFVIEGGNHAQFGNYGPNDGDGVATISAEEQQRQAVDLICDFIINNS